MYYKFQLYMIRGVSGDKIQTLLTLFPKKGQTPSPLPLNGKCKHGYSTKYIIRWCSEQFRNGMLVRPQSWKPRTPGYDIGPFLHNPSNVWASNLCFSETFEDIHL